MEKDSLSDIFSKVLGAAREKAGLSQKDLASSVGAGQSSISKWEKGTGTLPGADLLRKIAETLDISPNALLGWEEPAELKDTHQKPPLPANFTNAEILADLTEIKERVLSLETKLKKLTKSQ